MSTSEPDYIEYEYEAIDLTYTLEDREADDPMFIEFSCDAWDGYRFQAAFEFNQNMQEWFFSLSMLDFGLLIPRTVVKLDLPYAYRDYFRVIFIDQTDKHRRVGAKALGNDVEMTLWPGPDNPAYEPYEPDDREELYESPLETLQFEYEPWMRVIGRRPGTSLRRFT